MPEFDKTYWEDHWHGSDPESLSGAGPNPYLRQAADTLVAGTALDAGCGTGAESIWLATQGWQVTAVDISASALAQAARRAQYAGVADRIDWVEADLTTWTPSSSRGFDLVTTSYAHSTIPQLEFFDLLSAWVAPGGTLMIVGHRPTPADADHGHVPPEAATFTVADMLPRVDPAAWEISTAVQRTRRNSGSHGPATLHDVVIQLRRRAV